MLHIDVQKINGGLIQRLFFLLSYCFWYLILNKFCRVLTCNILGIGLLYVQYLFKTIICSNVKMKKKSHNIPLKASFCLEMIQFSTAILEGTSCH